MRSLARMVSMIAVMTALVAVSAWGGSVSMSWTDAHGLQTVELTNTAHPGYDPGDPYTVEDPYCWRTPEGGINVYINTPDPVTFSVSGNFRGISNKVWSQVWVEQHVWNETTLIWDKFVIAIVDEDGYVNHWQGDQETNWSNYSEDFYAELTSEDPAFNIVPWGGNPLDDSILFYANLVGDNGTLTFTKRPFGVPIVPEPGSLAVFLVGTVGLTAFVRRRRA